jgi:hypothetical protein
LAPFPFAQANSAFVTAHAAAKFFRQARSSRIDLRPKDTLGFKQLAATGAPQARRVDRASIKGSFIVAEIIDLGTTGAAGVVAFGAADPRVSGLGDVGGQKVSHQAGESLRQLIGKRYHAS